MADPVTLGVIITGLVGAYKAYADYKAATVKEVAAAKSAEAAKGEQAAPLVKAAVQQHGDAKDQRALESFEDDPEMYEGALKTMLTRLADRSSAFATQLQTLAQQTNIETGVQGNVNVSGEGKIYGPATGVNQGEITYTYNPNDNKDTK